MKIRLLAIVRCLVRHRLDSLVVDAFPSIAHRWWFQALTLFAPGAPLSQPRGERLRASFESLGPIFVKFGQLLSTRRDILPEDIADALAKLQDRVAPFNSALAIQEIERGLGQSIDQLYRSFEVEPIASASISQVHFAKMHDGREVAVKVLRPGMLGFIDADLALMRQFASVLLKLSADARRLRLLDVIDEFDMILHDELDLLREAANANQLRRNFADSPLLLMPEMIWSATANNVLTMQRMQGIPISRIDALLEAGIDLKRLSRDGVEIFFTQVFRDGFFHADMHPGNIFVLVDDPARPRYAAVDFGIVGTLDLRDMHYLAENFLAVFDRNYRRVAELHVESGWVPQSTRVDEMESAIRTVLEPIFDRPLKDISFGTILLRLFDISRRFEMRIQPQLILLQKTLLNIEGLGRDLYPELDIWQTAAPVLRAWMRDRLSPRTQFRQARRHLPALLEVAQALPPLLKVAVQKAQDGKLHIGVQPADLERLRQDIREGERRRNATLLAGVLALSGFLWLDADAATPWLAPLLIGAAVLVYWRGRR